MARYRALVAGASGVAGRRFAEYAASLPDWEVTGIARRPPDRLSGCRVLAVDLTDSKACRDALGGLTGLTHVIYAARYDHTTTAKEPVDRNAVMLRNLLDAVEPAARNFQHVHLVHGTKYYGSDLGPFKTPARESDPRVIAHSFYYDQEDLVIERGRSGGWTWSASRPHGICDHAPGIARSMAMVIAVYAAISRELGQPLCFPGRPGNYTALYQCTDATLLARAVAWFATEPRCANQAFNVTNGDLFRWQTLWPGIARYFNMEPGPVRTVRLAQVMADKAPVWERIVKRHALQPTPYEQAALWPYGDFIFGHEYDMISDMTKARESGFHEVVDTEKMFVRLFDHFRRERIIP